MKMEISVIVPIYRVERYLPACIESILNQTFADFELILVDDGSPDGCGVLCDEAAKKDARVRVIHQANQGLSAARNAGIEAARGAWLSFVDADDWVAPTFLYTLHEAAVREKADCAICGIQVTDADGKPTESPFPTDVPDGMTTGRKTLETIREQSNIPYLVAWNKLYRREVWRTLRYPTGRRNEDVFVFAKLFDTAKTVACVGQRLYDYRQSEGSIMHSGVTLRNLDEVWAYAHCLDYFDAHGMDDLTLYAEKRMFGKLTGVYYRLPKDARHSEEMKKARKAQWKAMKRICRKKRRLGGEFVRSLTFYAAPGLYALRVRKLLNP